MTRKASLSLILLLGITPGLTLAQTAFVQKATLPAQSNPPKGGGGTAVKPAPVKPVSTAAPTGLGGLLGSTVAWQYYAYGYSYDGSGQFVVNGGVDGTFQDYFNIIGDENSITFDYSIYPQASDVWSPSVLSLPPTIYNGIALNMVNGPAFLAVAIDPATNMVGFDASHLSFTGNQIQVDWQNLAFTPSTIVKLDVITPNSTLCQQDQYGNQYNFTVDESLNYVYGSVTNAQGCTSEKWPLIGSYTKSSSGLALALTASNPSLDGCLPLYSLAGVYPNFKWLYSNGINDPQNSSYVACGTQPSRDVVGKGALK